MSKFVFFTKWSESARVNFEVKRNCITIVFEEMKKTVQKYEK